MSKPNRPKFFTFAGFFQITRVQNLFIVVLSQYLTAIFLIGGVNSFDRLADIDLLILVISTILIAAAGYIINDYYDIKIDLINKPEKVIVGTILQRRSAILAHSLFNFSGIGLGFLIDYRIGIINFLAAFLLWLYSNQLKRVAFFGNLVVAILAATTVLMVGVFYNDLNMAIILYSTFAFASNLVREIVKDIEDLQGDEKFGSKTLPIAIGVRRTKVTLLLINGSFLIFVIYLIDRSSFPGPDYILFFLMVPVILLSGFLIRADKKRDFSILSTSIKWFMLGGILSMFLIHG